MAEPTRRWTREEEDYLLANLDKDRDELAEALDRTKKAIERKIEKMGSEYAEDLSYPVCSPKKAVAVQIDDPVIIAGDWHLPYHNRDMVKRLFLVRKVRGIKKLIINGDFLNLDSLSGFLSPPCPLETEIEEAGRLLEKITEEFEEVLYIPGNHEKRVSRKLNVMLPWEKVLRMITNSKVVKTTSHDYITMLRDGQTWRICHPGTYSKVKGSVAVQLTDIFHQNVVCGHSHHMGLAFSRSGRYLAIDGGGMMDDRLLDYAHVTNLYPVWNPGFVVLSDGVELHTSVGDTVHKV